MRTSLLVVLVLAVALGSVPAQDKAAKTDAEKLQGTWTVISYEDADEKAPDKDLKDWTYIFKGNKISIDKKANAEPVDTFKLNEGKKPKEIDMMIGNQKCTGIYNLEGDRLTIRIYFDGTARPKSMTGALGKFESRIELKRQKS